MILDSSKEEERGCRQRQFEVHVVLVLKLLVPLIQIFNFKTLKNTFLK